MTLAIDKCTFYNNFKQLSPISRPNAIYFRRGWRNSQTKVPPVIALQITEATTVTARQRGQNRRKLPTLSFCQLRQVKQNKIILLVTPTLGQATLQTLL